MKLKYGEQCKNDWFDMNADRLYNVAYWCFESAGWVRYECAPARMLTDKSFPIDQNKEVWIEMVDYLCMLLDTYKIEYIVKKEEKDGWTTITVTPLKPIDKNTREKMWLLFTGRSSDHV
jgi:hypothetical protein